MNRRRLLVALVGHLGKETALGPMVQTACVRRPALRP
jgi:hypothetical protein